MLPLIWWLCKPEESWRASVELAALSALPEVFRLLVEVMQEKGMWAYQEGIARVLAEDVKGEGRRDDF